ncbi:MAG: 16S rRNA (cytosine(967)-C(5))-methyltransferase RsmB [Lachnospiraceae bacterium]|nr:16S rRNA (cytosine(967)-C(5))-methyltransferase RsmB [Lachnospiraceae bacterium]
MNERELILQILLEAEKTGSFTGVILNQVLDKYDYLEPSEKRRIKRTVNGVTERQIELDYRLGLYSKTPVRKMKPLIRCLLRMSTYQILYMDKASDFAVCNEAVKLAKSHKFSQLSGFVNGVLRSIVREKDTISYPSEEKEPMRALSIRSSIPEEVLQLWKDAYGMEKTKQMATEQLESRPLSFRMKLSLEKEEKDALLEKMKAEGIQVTPHPYLPYAYLAEGMDKVTEIPGFAEGLITIQDVSSMLPAAYAGIRSGDLVVDLCAAPGGKSLMAAELTGPEGMVYARDLTPEKIGKIEENAARMGLTNINTRVWDARIPDPDLAGKADVVLADLPCSGLGVLNRKPEIKYHVTKESIRELVQLQQEILRMGVSCLKPGGKLLYSTCTVNPFENDEQADFIQNELGLTPICFSSDRPDDAALSRLQIFPGEAGDRANMDGFFLALFQK